MLILFFFYSLLLIFLILTLFFMVSKNIYWDKNMNSTFECGFTCYFFTRYSFSVHYFIIGIIFLFLDLELCFLMPFFSNEFSSLSTYTSSSTFILILILGVLLEWNMGQLKWKF